MHPGLKLLLSALFAVIGGVVTSYAFSLSANEGFFAGLGLFGVTEMAFVLLALGHVEQQASAGHQLLKIGTAFRSIEYYHQLLIIESANNWARTIAREGVEIRDLKEIALVWQRCISNVEISLEVSSYCASEHWWKTGYAQRTLDEQRNKVQGGATVMRLFVVDEVSWIDDPNFANVLELHTRGGLRVSATLRGDLENDVRIAACVKELKTLDFGLIDQTVVVLHFLDGQRSSKSLQVTRDPAMVTAARQYFEYARAIPSRIPATLPAGARPTSGSRF